MNIKQIVKRAFPSVVAFRNRVYNYLAHYRFRKWSAEKVFETIYLENHWKDIESKSGTGSNTRSTATVVQIISQVIQTLQIKVILDIPCGDFNWMQKVNLNCVNYLGADIVTDLVTKNNQQHASQGIKFEKLNILEASLPTVDLILCRDCLVHFSYADIHRAIESVIKSGSTYWLTTTFPANKNYDIITGDWRPINLQDAPFFFPEPLYSYSELCIEDERYANKSLAVWRIADL